MGKDASKPRRRVKAAMGGKGARDGGRNGSVSGGSSTVSPTAIAGGVVVAITLLGVGWLTMAPEATTLAEAVQHITRRASGSSRPFDPETVDENPDMAPDPLEIMQEKFNVTLLNEDPPVFQFENFITSKEADGLIKLARGRFARSTTGLDRDKKDQSRTSSTAWLIDNEHYNNALIKRIEDRMAGVMNVPATNQEGFQVLEYQLGEYYREHHDFLPEMRAWPCGVRLATFYLYLSDVEEGGGTWFPQLNLTGVPKKGRALLWYNVKKSPSGRWEQDSRTQHEAVPVIRGTKYGANKWVHVKDWVTPWRAGKTG